MTGELQQQLIRKALERGEAVRLTMAAFAAGSLSLDTPGPQLEGKHPAYHGAKSLETLKRVRRSKTREAVYGRLPTAQRRQGQGEN